MNSRPVSTKKAMRAGIIMRGAIAASLCHRVRETAAPPRQRVAITAVPVSGARCSAGVIPASVVLHLAHVIFQASARFIGVMHVGCLHGGDAVEPEVAKILA